MSDQSRLFEAGPDPFGRMWKVQFRWLQTAISIRHADTIDVKFFVTPDDGPTEEKVVALPRAALLDLAKHHSHPLSDPHCMRIAAEHLKHMIETSVDMDKTLVTVSPGELCAYDQQLHRVTVPHRG
jgi:3-mercaptopyruvate sulfurtransferase SseA